jgi:L,D-transpeptidase YcbB
MSMNWNSKATGAAKILALSLICSWATIPAFISAVHAESETSEQWRLERVNKKDGVTSFKSGTKTATTFHGGGGDAVTQTEIIADQAQIPMLTSKSDAALQAAQSKYSAIVAQGGFPKIPSGNYKKGADGKAVEILNQRLFIEGYLRVEGTQGDVASVFTTATQDAVSRYQRNLGLGVTGRVDNATLAELNISAESRLQAISANIPRLAIYEQGLGDRYVIVNIAAQQIETVSNGHVFSRHNAIVGRPERPSPVVMAPLDTVKFNPYWNAPVSIVERDIIPKMQANPQFLTSMNMKVYQGIGGPEVDPKSIDWAHAIPDDYQFRQEPGPENAMKTAKIEFNSPFGIYLHDTPEPQLFKTNNRFYSSGCIRVEKMPLLVEWVLNGQEGFDSSKISSMSETLERLDVKIAAAPQLRVAYLTAWPTSNGTVAFRRDIYDLDGSGFTVGQPMPVGENSPEGTRFVLKPLPRQVSVDTAEADGFNLFSSRPAKKSADPLAPKKNLFGKALFTTTGTKSQPYPVKVIKANVSSQDSTLPKTTKKKTDTFAATSSKAPGLFDWAAYRKQQALDANAPKGKKKVKAIDGATAKADSAKLKSTAKKLAPDAKLTTDDTKSKTTAKPVKKVDTAIALADPCAAVNGKIPVDCQPAKKP